MRLPEKCFEWQAGAWTFGITLCPGTWAVIVFWDGNPYGLAVALPLVRFWCERDGGRYWPWEWTILRVIIGKQEFRVDLALNYWGIGVDLVETDDWFDPPRTTRRKLAATGKKMTSTRPAWVDINPKTGEFIANKQAAKTVHRIYEMVADGMGCYTVARRLQAE